MQVEKVHFIRHMAFFADPDGNGLMLHHRYAPHAG